MVIRVHVIKEFRGRTAFVVVSIDACIFILQVIILCRSINIWVLLMSEISHLCIMFLILTAQYKRRRTEIRIFKENYIF